MLFRYLFMIAIMVIVVIIYFIRNSFDDIL
jgi:hypothetical protein